MRSLRFARRFAPGLEAVYAVSFERVPESAAAARRLAVLALAAWGLPQLEDTAVLVLSELVSNAVRHACGEGMRVTVERVSERRVRVSVLDRDRTQPRMRSAGADAERGRGLFIVAAASASWGVDLLPGGKRVWACLVAA